MELRDKKVLVYGAGKSGIAATKLLMGVGAIPIIYDGNADLNKAEVTEKLDGKECRIISGEFDERLLEEVAMLVISPGIPVDTPFVDRFKVKNIPVWGEIELAYRYCNGRIAAITGTNGKTTTTALTGEIVKDYFGKSFVVGNIGNPFTDEALKIENDDITVAEISSFQLETAIEFHPCVSAILNITPDHLNRHHTMEEYVRVKESVAKNQTKDETCVLNYEDSYLRTFADRCPAKVFWFSSKTELDEGLYLKDDEIIYAKNCCHTVILNVHDMKLLGVHNAENVMAAMAVGLSLGIPMESIVSTVKNFKAVEHRIEYVDTVDGVEYYNDSKGTNPDAAIKGIQAMNRTTVLIGGGYDKQNEYDDWIESFDGKVSYLILIGQTKEKIRDCAFKHGFENVILAESFEEAMNIAREKASCGDAVLLSPACASWGMFPNYEVRGKEFKRIVENFKKN